jgi:two-component system, NtrC family, sensor kinase
MYDESAVLGLAPDFDQQGGVRRELAAARLELAARDKTIRVLIARVEGQLARKQSAIAVLEQNISLEHKVQRRTRELEESHESLSRTLAELKQAQSQLLEANKLESIGQLAAGVAHEINTPVQYVTDNAGFLKEAFEKLMAALTETLGVVRKLAATSPDVTPLRELDEHLAAQGVTWICEQIPRAIEQSLEGLERVATIVGAMKEFSHPSAAEKQLIDLHDAIRTTITVARHEWKYVAQVATQFDANVPHVPCLRNELNQVILNLIVNAAHAIAERTGGGNAEKGLISISTELIGKEVELRVRDNGAGIPKAVAGRIYDPFFTTKPVGKGTGQGLAIARSVVVDKHGGSIRFESEQGQGTCFFIRLPIAGKGSAVDLLAIG